MTRTATARPTPPEDSCFKSIGNLVKKSEGGGPPVFCISTAVLDRHSDRVPPDAIKTESFKTNPVLLWNHEDWKPAIGTCDVFREGDEWFMKPTFDGIGELSKEVADKVEAGTLRTCSIRFRFKEFEFNAEGGLDYEDVELLEVSIVNIPANPEAIRVKATQQPTKPKQKNNTSTEEAPVEETSAKALEQGDIDAIQAAVTAALAPVLEKLDALQDAISGVTSQSEDGAPEGEEEKDGEPEEDETIEMSDEEAEEMKAFLTGRPDPKPKKK